VRLRRGFFKTFVKYGSRDSASENMTTYFIRNTVIIFNGVPCTYKAHFLPGELTGAADAEWSEF